MDHDETPTGPSAHAGHCANCGAALAHDQRYCLTCGTRRGPLPRVMDGTLRELRAPEMPSALVPVGAAVADDEEPDEPVSSSPGWLPAISLPTPRVASLAVMAMLSFGVVAGSLTAPGGIDALAKTFVVSVTPSSHPPQPIAGNTGGGGGGGGPQTQQTITVTSPAPTTPAGTTSSGGGGGGTSGGASGGGNGSAAVTLPPIKHVFMIMLSGQGYNQAFGTSTGHTYLGKTLPAQGELLSDYYGVASSSLANEVALFSGQGPTNQTVADCPQYNPITPGTTAGQYDQVQGDGCVYPQSTPTLPDELDANGYTWKAYLQSSTSAPAGQPATCRHPASGASDPNNTPQSNDPYVTWRNPFVYFQSITSSPVCAASDVDLGQLSKDLKQTTTTPNVSYIAPDVCDDGADQPCAPGSPSGLAAADTFLQTVVPEILHSPAYKADGMIVITFDNAPQSGPTADTSSCCDQPVFPNLTGGASSGTSTTISSTTSTGGTPTDTTSTSSTAPTPTTATSTTDTTPASTSSTSVTGTPPTTPTSGTSSTTGTTPGDASCAPPGTTSGTGTTTTGTTSTSTASTTTSGATTPPTTTGSTSTPTTTSSTTTTSTPTTTGASTGTPCGGGQVGALVLSKYVQAGSSDVASQFNHFSLLRTIEDLFAIKHLGYSADAALPEFDSSVFNAATSG